MKGNMDIRKGPVLSSRCMTLLDRSGSPTITKTYASRQSYEIETEAYRILHGADYLPELLEVGDNYIKIEYLDTSLMEYANKNGRLPYDLAKQMYLAFTDMILKGVYNIGDYAKLDQHFFVKDGILKLIDYDMADLNIHPDTLAKIKEQLDTEFAFLQHEDTTSGRAHLEHMSEYFNPDICDDYVEHMEKFY